MPRAAPPPPTLPTAVWASGIGNEEKDNEPPLPSPLLVPSLPSRPPHVFRRSTAALYRHGGGSRPTQLGGVAEETSCRKTPLSAPMEDLQTRLREKLHSKLDGGSLLSPVTVAKGQEVCICVWVVRGNLSIYLSTYLGVEGAAAAPRHPARECSARRGLGAAGCR